MSDCPMQVKSHFGQVKLWTSLINLAGEKWKTICNRVYDKLNSKFFARFCIQNPLSITLYQHHVMQILTRLKFYRVLSSEMSTRTLVQIPTSKTIYILTPQIKDNLKILLIRCQLSPSKYKLTYGIYIFSEYFLLCLHWKSATFNFFFMH